MYKYITKKLLLSLSMGIFVGLGILITYAANITSISGTYNSGDTLGIEWFNDIKSRLSNIYGSGTNVGIGISNPGAKLDVSTEIMSSESGDVGPALVLRNTSKTTPGNAYKWRIFNMSGIYGNKLGFYNYDYTNPCSGGMCNERFSIYDNGNVYIPGKLGIGTNSPTTSLDVNGNLKTSGHQFIRNGGPILYLQDTDSRASMIYNNSNLLYFLRASGPDSTTWEAYNDYRPLYLNLDNNNAQFGGAVYALGGFGTSSDIRLKTNITKIENPIEKIQKLNGYTFDWKETGKHDIGVIAQEVEEVFPEIISETENAKGEKYKSVNYSNLVAPLIEAIKEQQKEIESLKNEITEIKNNM